MLLSACAGAGGKRGAAKQPDKTVQTAQTLKKEISYLTFSLPEQVQWERNPDEALANAGVAEWILAGYTAADTPARVMYQKLEPAQAPAALKGQVLGPLKTCPDSQISDFKGLSKYRQQVNFEAICSQLVPNNFGLISYVSIFTDQTANHMVITEIRTPASKKAGVLTFQNTEAQKQAETSKILSELLYNLMQTIRICDEKNLCI
ncbi:MAG: hypothetical protein GX087_05560 [Desulfobulbaceae bacterium]|nr:hypothetical protein [Desulfobulbaceae bacterium]